MRRSAAIGAVLLLAIGLVLLATGSVWTVRGYWPWRIGEAFDFIMVGGACIGGSVLVYFRARKHQRGVLLRDMEELQHFPSDADRQAAIDEVTNELRRSREEGRLAVLVVSLVAPILFIPIYLFIRGQASRYLPLTLAKLIGWGVGLVMMLIPIWLNIRRGAPTLLRKKLLARGVPVCMNCGYVLRGCPGPNCPECGRPFDEQVRAILAGDLALNAGRE